MQWTTTCPLCRCYNEHFPIFALFHKHLSIHQYVFCFDTLQSCRHQYISPLKISAWISLKFIISKATSNYLCIILQSRFYKTETREMKLTFSILKVNFKTWKLFPHEKVGITGSFNIYPNRAGFGSTYANIYPNIFVGCHLGQLCARNTKIRYYPCL